MLSLTKFEGKGLYKAMNTKSPFTNFLPGASGWLNWLRLWLRS